MSIPLSAPFLCMIQVGPGLQARSSGWTTMKNGVMKEYWKCMSDFAEYQSGGENSPMELALWNNPGSSVVQLYSKCIPLDEPGSG